MRSRGFICAMTTFFFAVVHAASPSFTFLLNPIGGTFYQNYERWSSNRPSLMLGYVEHQAHAGHIHYQVGFHRS